MQEAQRILQHLSLRHSSPNRVVGLGQIVVAFECRIKDEAELAVGFEVVLLFV